MSVWVGIAIMDNAVLIWQRTLRWRCFRGMCGFVVPGIGTTYIAVFEDNEGAKNMAQNPVCTSNSKHIDVRPPVLRELVFSGRCLVVRV